MSLDYSKWDQLIDSDDEGDAKKNTTTIDDSMKASSSAAAAASSSSGRAIVQSPIANALTALTTLEPLQVQKQVADELFAQADGKGDEGGKKSGAAYSPALDRYESLITAAQEAARSAPTDSDVYTVSKRLEFSCYLNAATCFLRMQQWQETIDRVGKALAMIKDEAPRASLQITTDKIMRARQMKVLASLELGGTEALHQAQREAELMRMIIRKAEKSTSAADKLSPERLFEYQHVLDAVKRKCTAVGMDIVQRASALALEPDDALGKARRQLQSSWDLVKAKRHRDATLLLDSAIADIAQLISSPTNGSGVSSEARTLMQQLWQSKISTCDALGDALLSAETYEGYSKHCPPNEAGAFALKAGAAYFKLRRYDRALECYQSSHTASCSAQLAPHAGSTGSLIDDAPSPEDEDEDSAIAPRDLLRMIALAGAGASLLKMNFHDDCITILDEAARHLLGRLDSLLAAAAPPPESPSQQHLATVISTMQHLWNALDGLTDAHSHLGQYERAGEAAEQALLACDAVLALGGHDVTSKRKSSAALSSASSSSSNSTSSNANSMAILRKRRACTLLSKGHLVCALAKEERQTLAEERRLAAGDGVVGGEGLGNAVAESGRWDVSLDPELMSNASRYWSLAADELSLLGDSRQAMAAYHNVASMWTEAAGVEAFAFDAVVDREAAEAGHDAWRLVAQQALRLADGILPRVRVALQQHALKAQQLQIARRKQPAAQELVKSGKEEKVADSDSDDDALLISDYYSCLNEALQALYNGGICAAQLDDKLATRALEAAQQVQRDMEQVPISLDETEQLAVTVRCGDLAYYCAHCNLKQGNAEASLEQLKRAWDYYTRAEDRKKRKLVAGMRAMAHAAAGHRSQAEESIQQLRSLCLQPVEDPDKEVEALQGIITRRFKEVIAPAAMPLTLPPLSKRITRFLNLLYKESFKDTQATVTSFGLLGMFAAGLVSLLLKLSTGGVPVPVAVPARVPRGM